MPNRIFTAAQRLFSLFPADPRITKVIEQFPPEKHKPSARSMRIAVQGVEDLFYLALFGILVTELRKTADVTVDLIQTKSISGAVGKSPVHFIARSLPVAWIVNAQWSRVYRRFVDSIAYRSQSLAHPIADIRDFFRSFRIWRVLIADQQIDQFQISGIKAGDLIIDTYLRFCPSPVFNRRDILVWIIIWQTCKDIRRARRYFHHCKPDFYFSTYTTYIEHGVAVRVAAAEGVAIRTFGSFLVFGKHITDASPHHTPGGEGYRQGFAALEQQDRWLQSADDALSKRFSGEIDKAISYMKASAYSQSQEEVPDLADTVVVFLHDFFDSPHVFEDIFFTDFWDWITYTIDVLTQGERRVCLKPHPNQCHDSSAVVQDLLRQFPSVQFISQNITNKQLAEAGIICGVTMYGTVAHELAYFGIPTITCARHPHHTFNFCRTAKTKEEYANFLRTPEVRLLSKEDMKKEALMFYHMHNSMNYGPDAELKEKLITLWKLCNASADNTQDIIDTLAAIRQSAGLDNFLRYLLSDENSIGNKS